MAILEIKTAGDPVLKEHCAEVTKIDKRLRNFLDDMAETMYASEGVGIYDSDFFLPRVIFCAMSMKSCPLR